MSNLLVNGIYDLDYFKLAGVSTIEYPDKLFWSSRERFASVDTNGNYLPASTGGQITSEYVELDLGTSRMVNYLNLSVLRVPVNIVVEYDSLSAGDGTRNWVRAQRLDNMNFDDQVFYDANAKNAWFDAEFYLQDTKGNLIQTRYLRVGFTRRDEQWPTNSSVPFPYPVLVRHLRTGRYISEVGETLGDLINPQTATPILLPLSASGINPMQSDEIRQQFVYPADAKRGSLVPNLLGVSVLVRADDTENTSYGWSLWDVTSTPVKLQDGIESVAPHVGECWLTINFATPQQGNTSAIYELRVMSLNMFASSNVYTNAPNTLSQTAIPGTLAFTHGSTNVTTSVDTRSVVKVGSYLQKTDTPEQVYTVTAVTNTTITLNTPYAGLTAAGVAGALTYAFSTYVAGTGFVADATKHLMVRVWVDTFARGKDILGNTYRYGSHHDSAPNVFDDSKGGWMSAPQPSPDAVEALYFDVRTTDQFGKSALALIDTLEIAPRTKGIIMHAYYSQERLAGLAPETTDEWDNLLWRPIPVSYLLKGKYTIEFPTPVKAAYVKLEFTNLNPMPYRVPAYPSLPPKRFRRYPTWVEDQFRAGSFQTTVNDWFLKSATPVQTRVLASLRDPVNEFAYKERLYLSNLALVGSDQTVNDTLTSTDENDPIDPFTAQQVFIATPDMYADDVLKTVKKNSLLGQMVVNQNDPRTITRPSEQQNGAQADPVPTVSSTNDRAGVAYSQIAPSPMYFFKQCRHDYRIDEASFNKKAYFVGINSVRFLRRDFTKAHDDPFIEETLYDDNFLVSNTWVREEGTGIADGQTLYVSYQVGDQTILDEVVELAADTPVQLAVPGDARNLLVFAGPAQTGVAFYQDSDFVLGRADGQGVRWVTIARSTFGERLIVPTQEVDYVDVGTAIGRATVPAQPTIDLATVTAVAVISAPFEGPDIPVFGSGEFGSGTMADLRQHATDAGTTTAAAVPSGTDTKQQVESATVTGTAVPSGTDTKTP